jgi:hypothetical protein
MLIKLCIFKEKTYKCVSSNKLHPCSSALLVMLMITTQLVKKLSNFHGTQSFVNMFTNVCHCHWNLSWARWHIHAISLWSLLILFFYLCWQFPSGICPAQFVTKISYASHLPHGCSLLASCPLYYPWFYGHNILQKYKLRSFLLWNFPHPPLTSSLFNVNDVLSPPFSKWANLTQYLDLVLKITVTCHK